jgi:hypothetical protein
MMLEVDLEAVSQLVERSARFNRPWDAEQISSELVTAGWEPFGSVSLPYPKRLALGSLKLGILDAWDPAVIGVTLEEWPVDWNSAAYTSAVTGGYGDQIQAVQELTTRLNSLISHTSAVDPAPLVLDADEFPFVYAESWNVSGIYVTLGLEHLDPDDTPIRVSLYLSQGPSE